MRDEFEELEDYEGSKSTEATLPRGLLCRQVLSIPTAVRHLDQYHTRHRHTSYLH